MVAVAVIRIGRACGRPPPIIYADSTVRFGCFGLTRRMQYTLGRRDVVQEGACGNYGRDIDTVYPN